MKVAFSTWNQRVSPVFDACRKLLVLDVEEGGQVARRDEAFLDDDPLRKVTRLAELRVGTLVCGAISRPLADMTLRSGIHLIPFVCGDIEEVIKAYLSGGLPSESLSMPGCCRRRERFGPDGTYRERRGQDETIEGARAPLAKRRTTMPQGDGTGPEGKGPATGRGRGGCGPGRGTGQGKGAGRGQGRGTGQGRGSGKSSGGK